MNKNLLIVDDDPINLKLFSIVAEKNNWSFDTATDGPSAEKLLDENKYQVILLDIQLPGVNGLTLMQQIKEKLDVIIIVVTAFAMKDDKARIIKAGADEYVPKPVDINNLIKIVKNYL